MGEPVQSSPDNTTIVNDLQLISANNATAIEDLRIDYEKLKGHIEKLEHRLKQLEEPVVVTPVPAPVPVPVIIPEPVVVDEALQDIDIDDRYKNARAEHENKNYIEAEKYYKSMIGSKSSWYDERARFFLGKMYSDSGEYKKSIVTLQDFIDTYPKSKNIANALYAQAESFEKMKQKKEAEVFYKDLIQRFPNTKEAKQAKDRLKVL